MARGSVMKRGRRWMARVYRGIGANGKRVYEAKTFDTKREAERWLTAAQRDSDAGTVFTPSKQPLGDFLARWLEDVVRPAVGPATYTSYCKLVRNYVTPALGDRPLSALRKEEVQGFLADLVSRGLSPRTVRYTASVLRAALNRAVDWGKIARNPAQRLTLPKQPHKELRVLSFGEAQRFLDAAAETRFGALWAVLLTTGLRPSEALALKWDDIDGASLRVQRTLLENGEMAEPKTARGRRVVPLPELTVRALAEHRKRQAEERLRVGPEWRDEGLIFTTIRGGPLTLSNLTQRHFLPLLKRAGLPRIRLYDLRHSHATMLLALNTHPKIASERLGHSSVRLTMDTYSHVQPSMQVQVADVLERALSRRK